MVAKHTILSLPASDLQASADLIHASKLSLTINRLLYKNWPATETQKAQCLYAVTNASHDPTIESFKVEDPDTKELTGYLALSRKQPKEGKQAPILAANADGKFEQGILEWVNAASQELLGEFEGVDHFQLTFVCVQLEKRLQGVGRALVQLCIDKAKAEGIPLAVTAEPQSTVFFERLGFKEEKHVDIDLSEYAPSNSGFGVFRLTGMLWSPEN